MAVDKKRADRQIKVPSLIGLTSFGVLFGLTRAGVTHLILSQFSREASIYSELVGGLLYLSIILPCFVALTGGLAAIVAQRGQRLFASSVSVAIFTTLFGMSWSIERALKIDQSLHKHLKLKEIATQNPPNQMLQDLPLLDPNRPLTIASELETGSGVVVTSDKPLVVRAYARDQVSLPGDVLRAQLTVFLPGTIEKRIIGEATLVKTPVRTKDGRFVFEGSLSTHLNRMKKEFEMSPGAKAQSGLNGLLTVFGRDGITDQIFIAVK